MILTSTLTVTYDDETRLAAVHLRTQSSFFPDNEGAGPLVADGLTRLALLEVVRGCAGSIARDHQEVDGLPRSIR